MNKGVNDTPRGMVDKGIYDRWVGILLRCYSDSHHSKYPTYKGCYVCDEWLSLSNFSSWLSSKHGWETLDIDKDFLVDGNKKYGPDTCVLLPRYINSIRANTENHKLPLGVKQNPQSKIKPFFSRCNVMQDDGKIERKYLGSFEKAELAHTAWQMAKVEHIERVINVYSMEPFFDARVEEKLKSIANSIRCDIFNKRLTNNI